MMEINKKIDALQWINLYARDFLFAKFWKCYESTARLDNKTVLITGCNSGIGKETALDLCGRGARVIMACRDLKRATDAADDIRNQVSSCENPGEVTTVKLDLASLKSVRECAENILTNEERIDILINNAGVMTGSRELTEDDHELTFQTNYLGHYLLTLLLLPKMIESAPARIINVSSIGHTWGDGSIHFDDITLEKSYSITNAYGRTKLAQIFFTSVLAKKLEGTGVTAYAAHPGLVQTTITRHVAPILARIAETWSLSIVLKTPKQGAQTIIYCALDEEAGKETGLWYMDCAPAMPVKRARNEDIANQLWDFSWRAVKLPEDYNPFQTKRKGFVKSLRNLSPLSDEISFRHL